MKKSGTMSPYTSAWVGLPNVFANARATVLVVPPTTAADIRLSPTRKACSMAAFSCFSTPGTSTSRSTTAVSLGSPGNASGTVSVRSMRSAPTST